ncbi:arad-like aldolase/epimerase [Wallemia mellicola]|nr:arad-like aldolase/epimerase [Wallemia mellicola]
MILTEEKEDFTAFYIPESTYKKGLRQYIKERLALAFRFFAAHGMEEGASGHLTVRDCIDSNTFWVNPFGVPFEMMTASDLLRIDHSGRIVEGGKPDRQYYNSAAYVIHAAVHYARPDANAVCHSHSRYTKAFSAFGRKLEMISQDACIFYNDHAVYGDFGGVVLKGEESAAIVAALKSNKALFMVNHGALTVGKTIESAAFWFYSLEKQCQVQLTIDSASTGRGWKPRIISTDSAQFTYDNTADEDSGRFEGECLFKSVEYRCNSAHKE